MSEAKLQAQHFHFCFISIPAPRRGSVVHYSKARALHSHICFISIPAPREGLRFIMCGRSIFTSAFQLPERACSSLFQNRAVHQKPLYFTVFQLPERACSSLFQIGRCTKTMYFTTFQLPERVCSSLFQSAGAPFSPLFYQHSSP